MEDYIKKTVENAVNGMLNFYNGIKNEEFFQRQIENHVVEVREKLFWDNLCFYLRIKGNYGHTLLNPISRVIVRRAQEKDSGFDKFIQDILDKRQK